MDDAASLVAVVTSVVDVEVVGFISVTILLIVAVGAVIVDIVAVTGVADVVIAVVADSMDVAFEAIVVSLFLQGSCSRAAVFSGLKLEFTVITRVGL